MQEWLDFYLRDAIVDPEHGTQFSEVMSYSMGQMDTEHHFIQWLFPNRRPSPINKLAPVMTAEMAAEFQGNAALREKVFMAIDRYLGFLGVKRAGHKVSRADSYHINCRYWLRCNEHNHLRISRLLHFLKDVKQDSLAQEIFSFLVGEMEVAGIAGNCQETIGYWKDVLNINV